MDLNKVNVGVYTIKELRIATAAVDATERLMKKEESGQILNDEEREALNDYYKGIAELVIRASSNMRLAHIE